MTIKEILVREYKTEDAPYLVKIYYNTIHKINIRDYTEEQVNVWAPETSLEVNGWTEKFERIKPFVAVIDNVIVGFAEFESNGHIDCFYCHHEWIGYGIGSALMNAIDTKAKQQKIERIYVEVSITARSFFEKHGFKLKEEQKVFLKGIGLTNFKMEKILNLNGSES